MPWETDEVNVTTSVSKQSRVNNKLSGISIRRRRLRRRTLNTIILSRGISMEFITTIHDMSFQSTMSVKRTFSTLEIWTTILLGIRSCWRHVGRIDWNSKSHIVGEEEKMLIACYCSTYKKRENVLLIDWRGSIKSN